MKVRIHNVCPICFYDLMEHADLLGLDVSFLERGILWGDEVIHIYWLRPIGSLVCEYDSHMYLVNLL